MIDSNNKLKSLSRALLESAQSILSEKKTVKKDLANLAPPYDKVTHADVLVGRKVFTHDEVKAHKAKKGIKEDAEMVVIHAPVLGDINGELAEVVKRDRRDKTVHVQYEGMKYVLKAGQYAELDEAVKNPYAVGMAAAMKSTGDTPPLKKSTITKAHEIAKKVAEETEQVNEDQTERDKLIAHYKADLPNMIKDIRGKRKSHSDLRREYGSSWKRLANSTADEHGHNYNRDHLLQVGQKHMNEGVEAIDEISKATMGRYINKAKDSIDLTSYRSGIKDGTAISSSKPYTSNNPLEKKLTKRHKGIETAVSKLTREESEQIDELSKKTLGSYVNKAAFKIGDQGITTGLKIQNNEPAGKNLKTMGKRQKGIEKAVNKLTKEESETQIDELSHDTLRRYRMKSKSIADNEGPSNYREKGRELAGRKTYGGRMAGIEKAKVMAKEEVEAIDELSSDLKTRYGIKAYDQLIAAQRTARDSDNNPAIRKLAANIARKRKVGVDRRSRQYAQDVEKQRRTYGVNKEEFEQIDELSHDTVKSYADKAMGDAVQKTQAQQKKKYASDIKADQKGIDKRVRGLTMAKKKMANEDVELTQEEIDFIEATMADLDEGRGRPPKEGSAAYKAKMQQDLSDMPALGVQIRKAASINKPVTFMDGKSKQISDNHINRFHDHMDSRKTSQDKSAFQKRAHKSHDEFVKAVSEPVPGRAKDTGEIVKYK